MLLSVVHVVFLGRAPCTKDSARFLLNYGFRKRGHNSVVSGYPTSTRFSQVDGWSTNPRVLGCQMYG